MPVLQAPVRRPSQVQVDSDGRCQDGLLVQECALCSPRTQQQPSTRDHSFDAPSGCLVEATRPAVGPMCVWYPHGSGSRSWLNPAAGHVHIVGGHGVELIKYVIRTCPDLYLITVAPTQAGALHRLIERIRDLGIGAATMRLRPA